MVRKVLEAQGLKTRPVVKGEVKLENKLAVEIVTMRLELVVRIMIRRPDPE